MILSGLSLWEKGSPLHKSTQQVRTQGPIRHADCRQRKLADFLCTGGIIQGPITRALSVIEESLIVFFVIQFNGCLILVRFNDQQIAAKMINHLFRRVAEECC
ncbi:Uncharacterised protein [Escherichia coli]|nr:hypothetical protein BvCmsL97A_01249 [Escherichia coli]SQP48677.1 Uncharacterised protein [Escherichia coli]